MTQEGTDPSRESGIVRLDVGDSAGVEREVTDSSIEADITAAEIEEKTTESIRARFIELQSKQIALLASVLALLVGILGALGKAPWDMAPLNTAAFFIFACGGLLPGLTSVFRRTKENLPRLSEDANTFSPEFLARLRWAFALSERIRASKKLQKESDRYWKWVKLAISATFVASMLVVLQFITTDRNNHEKHPITQETPRAVCQDQADCSPRAEPAASHLPPV